MTSTAGWDSDATESKKSGSEVNEDANLDGKVRRADSKGKPGLISKLLIFLIILII